VNFGKGLVSIVVPTFNRAAVLGETLRRLSLLDAAGGRIELLVVDDGSPDGTVELVGRHRAPFPVTLIENGTNMGRAATRNKGVAAAKGESILFLDDDIWVDPDLLVRLFGAGRDRPAPFGVVGRIESHFTGRSRALKIHQRRRDEWIRGEMLRRRDDLPGDFCLTGLLLVPRESFREAGGFDERFTLYGGEDTDLGRRLVESGTRLVYCDEARVQHVVDYTVRDYIRRCSELGVSMALMAGGEGNPQVAPGLLDAAWDCRGGMRAFLRNGVKRMLVTPPAATVTRALLGVIDGLGIAPSLTARYLLPLVKLQCTLRRRFPAPAAGNPA
jgi:GT2 family glycosyltransferase